MRSGRGEMDMMKRAIAAAAIAASMALAGTAGAAELGAMKIRIALSGGNAEVRTLIEHPMETGQRKDADGKPIPAHFIQTVTASVNGKEAMSIQVSQAVSRNPVFAFKLPGVKAGDRVSVAWTDSKGSSGSKEEMAR